MRRRQHDDTDHDRIEAEPGVDDIGDVRAEDDEGGMCDVDDVEDAERDRDAERHGGIEPAEQNAGNHGVDQQIEAEAHLFPPQPLSRQDMTQDMTHARGRACFACVPVCRKGAALASPFDRAARWRRAIAGGARQAVELASTASSSLRAGHPRVRVLRAREADGICAAYAAACCRTRSGSSIGLLALCRNSMVMKTISLSPRFSRSWTLNSPGP